MTAGVRLLETMVVVGGDSTAEVAGKVGTLATIGVAIDERELGIGSAKVAMTGAEACSERISKAVVSVTVAEWTMEPGAETAEAGDEVEERVLRVEETFSVKDSRLWDGHFSKVSEKQTVVVTFSAILISHNINTDLILSHLHLSEETGEFLSQQWVVV